MANVALGFAIIFCFLALLLVCLGFATDNWIDVAVRRDEIKVLYTPEQANSNPNIFTRHRGIFKVCYEGSETYFLDNNTNLVSGNCLWLKGLQMTADADSVNFEDEYEWRNHLIRAHMAATIMGMIALLAGVILASIGCWDLSPRGFRVAGLIIFVGAFFVACGMGCFHGYDYLEKSKIKQYQQGVFPLYWRDGQVDQYSKMNYGWSYIITWVGLGLAAVSAVLLLCTAYNLKYDEEYEKYSEKKLLKKVKRDNAYSGSKQAPPPAYGPPPVYATTPVPSAMGMPVAMGMPAPPVYGALPPAQAPIVEMPVEVSVPVPVEPPQIIPVIDDDPGYNEGYGYDDGYGGQGYGDYIDERPAFGPAPYGDFNGYY